MPNSLFGQNSNNTFDLSKPPPFSVFLLDFVFNWASLFREMATVDHVLQAHSLDVTRQAELIHILVDTTHGSNHKYRSKFSVSLKRFYPQLQVLVQQLKQLASLKTKAHWGKSLGGGPLSHLLMGQTFISLLSFLNKVTMQYKIWLQMEKAKMACLEFELRTVGGRGGRIQWAMVATP